MPSALQEETDAGGSCVGPALSLGQSLLCHEWPGCVGSLGACQ